MSLRRSLLCVGVLASLTWVCSAAEARSFVKVPKLDGRSPHLEMRFVRYRGSTNGRMIVDVRNRGKRAQRFTAKGIYFVPQGDPDKAPQRLGAAGPFELLKNGKRLRKSALVIAPAQKVRLHLHVYCIDSHRSSPSSRNRFKIAKKRMPKRLRNAIEAGAQRIMRKAKRPAAAKGAVQSHVWSARNKKWIKLEGERKNERVRSKRKSPRRMRQRIR